MPLKLRIPANGLGTPNVEVTPAELFNPSVNKLWRTDTRITGRQFFEIEAALCNRHNLRTAPSVFLYSFNDHLQTNDPTLLTDAFDKMFGHVPDEHLWALRYLSLYLVPHRLNGTFNIGQFVILRDNSTDDFNLNIDAGRYEEYQGDVSDEGFKTFVNGLIAKVISNRTDTIRPSNLDRLIYPGFWAGTSVWAKLQYMLFGKSYIRSSGTNYSAATLNQAIEAGHNFKIRLTDEMFRIGQWDGVLTELITRENRTPLYQVLSYSTNVTQMLEWPLKARNEHSPILYGVELECATDYSVREVIDAADEPFFLAKQDSSITGTKPNKMELVTVPASLKALKRQYALWFSKLDYSRFDCSTKTNNGMHVHVGRDHFDDEAHIKRFCWFFHNPSNTELIVRLSERGSVQAMMTYTPIFQFQAGSSRVQCFKSLTSMLRGQRGATNLGSSKGTVEVRVFRGIVSYASILKNLEAVDAILNFTKEAGFPELNSKAFLSWLLNKTPANRYSVLKKFMEMSDLESINTAAELGEVLFCENDPEKIFERLKKSRIQITNAHVSILNRGRRRTFVLNKETNELELFVQNKGKVAHLDRELEKKYLRANAA